ncbi:ferredoxin [Paenibacillus darwinianus]|uniref:Ferredoxin n=1 Tax=Paenibacillus darwinianus TaxID=1380763 RepID=A0A9W5S308_9BACL|nr:2Fe-2S iron-sulfur cluster-binding protein [Paenibacillus darwinianus]EXX91311.1 ferredoxin [Paenibacillus darwinianus]EXX92189.1 ferredoxin [Paenibacillus darwinianus]EXX92479.1 ferredoxin [Paenibacillus darwinianus]
MKPAITFMPEGKTVSVRQGTSVLDAARRAGIPIKTRCGGKMGCLMCKVTQLSVGGLSESGEQERRKLAGLAEQGVRLACQAKVIGDASVEVPEDPLKSAVRRLLAKQAEEDDLW